MHDEEFVKLRLWLDAELTMIRMMLAIVLGILIHNKFFWVVVTIYTISAIIYAAARIRYVESKHRGYVTIPKV